MKWQLFQPLGAGLLRNANCAALMISFFCITAYYRCVEDTIVFKKNR